jgi:hypothetical protein
MYIKIKRSNMGDEIKPVNQSDTAENNDIKKEIAEIKKTVNLIHSVVSWILFMLIMPLILGFVVLCVSCLGHR